MSAAAFGIVAAVVLSSALFVVRARNLVHAVLWLGVTLAATAALFVMLSAPFLATVQVLLYVGGVMTLMVFGVMLTRRHDGLTVGAESRRALQGTLAAGGFFGVLATALLQPGALPETTGDAPVPDTAALGAVLLGEQLLAFEVLSLLLLAAIIGAAVIARRRDPGALDPRHWAVVPARRVSVSDEATKERAEPATAELRSATPGEEGSS